MEPLSRESICAPQNRDPVLSQVVTQLETGVKPAKGDVDGGGRKRLSYWSQWGKLFLRDGMVFRRWKREVTGQEIYHQICLPKVLCHKCCAPCTTILQQATLASRRLLKKCRGDFIGMACGKMSKCMLEGVSHVLKSTTLASFQRHPL